MNCKCKNCGKAFSEPVKHKVLCGDATKAEDVARLMAGEKADMVFSDPPYNVALGVTSRDAAAADAKARHRRTDGLIVTNDDLSDGEFRAFLVLFYKAALDVTKAGGAIYICHADTEGINFRSAMIEAGWMLKQCLIWVKQQFVMGRQDYQWQHEPILYGWKPGAAHSWFSDRRQTTCWNFDRPFTSKLHPTMKPVELVERALINSSKSDDIVLDLFGGAGSTLIACAKNGRVCRMSELDQKYVDVIILRWQEFVGQQATLDGDGRTFEEVKAARAAERD
jgi:DNA modification methylase